MVVPLWNKEAARNHECGNEKQGTNTDEGRREGVAALDTKVVIGKDDESGRKEKALTRFSLTERPHKRGNLHDCR